MSINIDGVKYFQKELRKADIDFSGEIDSPEEIEKALALILNGRKLEELPQKYQTILRKYVDSKSAEEYAFNETIDPPELETAINELMKFYQNKESLLKDLVYGETNNVNVIKKELEVDSSMKTTEFSGKTVKLELNKIEALWKKNRLLGKIIENGFEIYDPKQDVNLGDAEQFLLEIYQPIDYGEKRLRLKLEVGKNYSPIWGNKLFQVQLNGVELKPINFSLDFGDDGKGFVPPASGIYEFEIPKEFDNLGIMTFMTAGGINYEVKVTEPEIVVKPEKAPIKKQFIQYNQIGYIKGFSKTAILELAADVPAKEINFFIKDKQNKVIFESKSKYNKEFKGSGAKVMLLDFSELNIPGDYTLVIPKQEGINEELSSSISVKSTLLEGYQQVRNNTLMAFKWFTCGEYGPYPGEHEQDKSTSVFGTDEKIDISGGWHDAGDFGKYTVNGGYSVGLMLLSKKYSDKGFNYEAGLVPRDNPERPDYLSITRQELDFLLKMQRADGAAYHKVASADWLTSEVAPEDDQQEKTVMPISTTATADLTAALALGFIKYRNSNIIEDRKIAEQYIAAAEKGWFFLEKNPNLIMVQESYDNHLYGGPYTDSKDKDERLWAAVELFDATEKEKYHQYIKDNILSVLDQVRFGDAIPDWANVNYLALFSYIQCPKADPQLVNKIKEKLLKYADDLLVQQSNNPYDLAFAGNEDKFDWGSNSVIATTALELMYIYKITGNDKYKVGSVKMLNYLLGNNPQGISYIIGQGNNSAQHPHFRPSMSGKYEAPAGMLVGGPNSVDYAGDVIALTIKNKPSMRIYADKQDSWSTNEVAINWQANITALLALICEE